MYQTFQEYRRGWLGGSMSGDIGVLRPEMEKLWAKSTQTATQSHPTGPMRPAYPRVLCVPAAVWQAPAPHCTCPGRFCPTQQQVAPFWAPVPRQKALLTPLCWWKPRVYGLHQPYWQNSQLHNTVIAHKPINQLTLLSKISSCKLVRINCGPMDPRASRATPRKPGPWAQRAQQTGEDV